jgi:hypothetical protein
MPTTSWYGQNSFGPWYDQHARNLIDRAHGLSELGYKPFTGPRVAAPSPDMNRADVLGRQEGLYKPYFNQAQQMSQSAATPFYENFQNYMNPFIGAILDRQRTEGLKTFNEGILPSLTSEFVQRGTYGSGQHRGMAERAARDVQQSIRDNQRQTLAGAYQQAAQTHASDADRRLQAGNQIAGLGQKSQAGNIADIAMLGSQGERARAIRQQDLDTGYNDYLRQTEYPWGQLSNFSSALQGAHIPSQGLQYTQTPATPQLNTSGQIAQLSGQLMSASRMNGGKLFKDGGKVAKKPVRQGLPMHSGLPKLKKKRVK